VCFSVFVFFFFFFFALKTPLLTALQNGILEVMIER